jgi:hypothetical protein
MTRVLQVSGILAAILCVGFFKGNKETGKILTSHK